MKETKAITSCLPYKVIRDLQEKEGHGWFFESSKYCSGTVVEHLKTGDYTLKGFESYLCIERKGSVKEFVSNLAEKRFRNELDRMAEITRPYVLLEFQISDILDWPNSAGVSPHTMSKLPLTQWGAAFSAFIKLKHDYPYVDFIPVGDKGKETARCIFKSVIERYAKYITFPCDSEANSYGNDEIK